MPNIGDMFVRIGADASDFERAMKRVQRSVSTVSREMMMAFKTAQMNVRADFQELGNSASQYAGKTDEFINKIHELGKKQKQITDEMIKNNEHLKTSYFQSIGQILARTNTSDKLVESLNRIKEPLRALDPMFLKIGSRLEDMAKQGNAAVLALKELGPTANMKQLLDLQRQITTMGAGVQMLQLGAAIVTMAEVAALVKLSNTIDGRLIPAMDSFKATWTEALTPFIHAFTTFAETLVNWGTQLGQLFANLAETNPVLSQMLWGFLALIPPLTMILAPLAIGLSFWNNYRAAFSMMFALIRPVVLAFLGVIGTVMLVSAAIVIAIAIWNQMMDASANLRAAVAKLWEALKEALAKGFKPLQDAFLQFKAKFAEMFEAITGKKATWENFWKMVGDVVAVAIEFITKYVIPLLAPVIEQMFKTVETTLRALAALFDFVAETWRTGGENIMNVVRSTWNSVISFFKGIDLFDIGKNIIKGLINGISSMASSLMDKARSIANSIKNTIKGSLSIHSPSRVMMGLGMNIGEGLQIGMTKTIADIENTALQMALPSMNSSMYLESQPTQQHYNFERLFEGANIQVRNESDIKKIARELYSLINQNGRGKGVMI